MFDAGLTTASDKWVQMHLINEKIGGEGKPYNLVPGPNAVNSGPMRAYEDTVRSLVKKPRNVVWVETVVSYYGATFAPFASNVQMKAGLYVFKGRQSGGKPKWDKLTAPKLQAAVPVPKPHLDASPVPVSLNLSSGQDIRTYFPSLTITAP